jgi:hypothetical protein
MILWNVSEKGKITTSSTTYNDLVLFGSTSLEIDSLLASILPQYTY